jgi:hypothetical protein
VQIFISTSLNSQVTKKSQKRISKNEVDLDRRFASVDFCMDQRSRSDRYINCFFENNGTFRPTDYDYSGTDDHNEAGNGVVTERVLFQWRYSQLLLSAWFYRPAMRIS